MFGFDMAVESTVALVLFEAKAFVSLAVDI